MAFFYERGTPLNLEPAFRGESVRWSDDVRGVVRVPAVASERGGVAGWGVGGAGTGGGDEWTERVGRLRAYLDVHQSFPEGHRANVYRQV